MNNTRRALIATIAGFTALGLAIIAVFYWAALAVPAFTLDLGQIDLPLRILVIGAIISFSIYILATPESVGRTVGKRSTRLTVNALVASIVVVAIAIVINTIVDAAPTVRADLTANQEFTLSEQSIKVVRDLDNHNANVTAIAFFSRGDPQSITEAEDLFKRYKSHTSRFSYEFVDPEVQPQRASQYNISRFGVVVLDDGKKREIADSASERDLTSALVRLVNTTPRTVAFLTGHGERDFNSLDQGGYSQAKESLVQNNYQTLVWSLTTSPTLTVSDVTVLIIAAPIRAIPANEVQIIQRYLDGGGHALILLDPPSTPEAAEALQSLDPILNKYGVTRQQGFVFDLQKRISQDDPSVFVVDSYPLTDITEALSKNRLPTIFPLAFGLAITNTVSGFTSNVLVRTSSGPPLSWVETNTINPQLAYDEGQDVPGPVNIAVSVEPSDPTATAPVTDTNTVTPTNQVSTRLVVFSDVDFAANFLLSGQAPFNSDLFGNSVSWLAGANELVSIRAKDAAAPRTITLDAGQKNLILVTTVLGLPMLVFLMGIFNWWRRR